ncbi:hypothetical protein PHET_02689 [Paragonimus heterotremus]|uniref:FERM domain-containing protein n=1 Tax=Paragonimus heterotremus TaxID=100268 RepID=A0A8J4TL92_9TREM|nr:hypothetical protein PHET_02689 [Paragonimus heterotremus]
MKDICSEHCLQSVGQMSEKLAYPFHFHTDVCPRSLNFRVKHYPNNPLSEFPQEKARYLLYLQLRRDLHSGRLIGKNAEMHMLAACILQAEIGDYDLLADYLGEEGTLADLKMFANVTPRTESRICDLHKTLKGMTMEEAENKFLDNASHFETYGIEPIYVQDRKGNHFYMGLSHEGVVTFRGSRKAHVFSWQKINKISYEGKLFIIQVEWEQRCHTLGFKCPTSESAEAVWKWAVDRQCFFTSVRQTRQSKSQNDLDRKLGASSDSLPDGHLKSTGGLQRHQSVLETRQTGDDSGILSVTNQLSNQVKGAARLSKPVNNSQSTPSLLQPSQPQSANEMEEEKLLASERKSHFTQTRNDGNLTDTRKERFKSDGEKNQAQSTVPPKDTAQKTNEQTKQVEKQTAGRNEVITEDKKMQPLTIKGTTDEVDNETHDQPKSRISSTLHQEKEQSDISDIEQNAEATDQPGEIGDVIANTGSVNTLSSSPLRSADEEEDEDDDDDREEEEEEELDDGIVGYDEGKNLKMDSKENDQRQSGKEITDRPMSVDRRSSVPKSPTELKADELQKTGKWLGPGGIKPFNEDMQNTRSVTDFVTALEAVNKSGQSPNAIPTNTVSQSRSSTKPFPLPSTSTAQSKDLSQSKVYRPTVLVGTVVNINPASSSDIRPSFVSAGSVSRTAITPAKKRQAARDIVLTKTAEPSSSETNHAIPPQALAGVLDVEEYIDSSETSPRNIGENTSFNSTTYADRCAETPPHTRPSFYSDKSDLYFPFAKTMRTTPTYSSLASRPQEYKTIAAIPSRRSPTRKEIHFARSSNQRHLVSASAVQESPQEISLSAENFTHLKRSVIFADSSRDSVGKETSKHADSSGIRFPRRSDDLSPQPRNWFQEVKTSASNNDLSGYSCLRELIIPSAATVLPVSSHELGKRSEGLWNPSINNSDSHVVKVSVSSCGLNASSLPPTARQGQNSLHPTEAYRSKISNDVLLHHGYLSMPTQHARSHSVCAEQTRGLREFKGAGSSAAQLAAGGTHAHRNIVPSIYSEVAHVTGLDRSSQGQGVEEDRRKMDGDKRRQSTSSMAVVPTVGTSKLQSDEKNGHSNNATGGIGQQIFRRSDSRPSLTPHSMRQISKHFDEALQSQINSGQRSVGQLSRSVCVPLLADSTVHPSTSRSTGFQHGSIGRELNSQTESSKPEEENLLPLLRHLFYFFLVGFCVFKLTGWLQIRPTFGQSVEEQNSLIRILSTVCGWIFSLN